MLLIRALFNAIEALITAMGFLCFLASIAGLVITRDTAFLLPIASGWIAFTLTSARMEAEQKRKEKCSGVIGPMVIEWDSKTNDVLREVFIPFTKGNHAE